MKAMLTSFGVEHSLLTADAADETTFHRMPPVSFRRVSETFVPDYELLLLCDGLVVDEVSYERLVTRSVAAYTEVSKVFEALESEGRIELADYSEALHARAVLLERMTDHDLRSLDQWVVPFRESLGLWAGFARMLPGLVDLEPSAALYQEQRLRQMGPREWSRSQAEQLVGIGHLYHGESRTVAELSLLVTEALASSTKRRRHEYRGALRDALRAYLTYVNSNLILSHHFECAFHDWLDFRPFYSAKFLPVGRDGDPLEDRRTQLEKLFTLPFPELAIKSPRALLKALNDKRLEDLRRLVTEAAEGRVQFDADFAKSVLSEVFRTSQRSKKARNVVGYVTLPIDFIPWVGAVAQKAVEEVAGIAIDRQYGRKHRWFYMLSEIVEAGEAG